MLSRSVSVFWPLLILIAGFGMLQASARIRYSLNVDEPFTANLIRLPWTQMFESFQSDNVGPAHPVLLKGWRYLFGESEPALRSLSLLFFGLTTIVVGLTAKQLAHWQVGLTAAILLTTSTPLGLIHAATARQYALLCLIASIATYIYLRLTHRLFRALTVWPAPLDGSCFICA